MKLSGSGESQLELSRNYHDLSSVNKLREAARSGDKGALEEAAKQFEAIFVQMMLSSMRKAQDALADKDSPFSSQQVKFYRDMHDKQLATDLSSSGSTGLADIIIAQMSPDSNIRPASIIRDGADMFSVNRDSLRSVQRAQDWVLQGSTLGASKQAAFGSPEEFVDTLYPKAIEAAKKLNIEPKALIAQAALETGWGKHLIHHPSGENSHNLFGIKADNRWNGEKAVVSTLEYVDNVPAKQQAAFRSYSSFADSMYDYASFIKSNARYDKALEVTKSPEQYFNALQEAGYATDPKYAEKIMSVYNGEVLGELIP